MEEYIVAFEQSNFQIDDMYDTIFHECFISGLKDDIWAHILIVHY